MALWAGRRFSWDPNTLLVLLTGTLRVRVLATRPARAQSSCYSGSTVTLSLRLRLPQPCAGQCQARPLQGRRRARGGPCDRGRRDSPLAGVLRLGGSDLAVALNSEPRICDEARRRRLRLAFSSTITIRLAKRPGHSATVRDGHWPPWYTDMQSP